jgi:hypothetical protein
VGVDIVKSDLDALRISVEDANEKIDEAIEEEQAYLSKPDTNGLDDWKMVMDDATQTIALTQDFLNNYFSELDKVKQAVAASDKDIDEKRSLQNLLDAPRQTQSISTFTGSANLMETEIQKIFDNAIIQREDLISNLNTRVARNDAYSQLFGANQLLIEKSNGDYSSLDQAVNSILSDELEFFWKEENEVTKLKENWRKAEAYYNQGNYALAEQFGKRTHTSAIRIYISGFKEQEEDTGPNYALLVNGIILVFIVLIVLYAIRNRKKLLALTSQEDSDEYY